MLHSHFIKKVLTSYTSNIHPAFIHFVSLLFWLTPISFTDNLEKYQYAVHERGNFILHMIRRNMVYNWIVELLETENDEYNHIFCAIVWGKLKILYCLQLQCIEQSAQSPNLYNFVHQTYKQNMNTWP